MTTKEEILQLLQQNETISGEAISQTLNISRAAVWKAIEALRKDGYQVEAATRRGYHLAEKPDRLDAALLCRRENVILLPTVDSTNRYLKQLADEGAPAGTIVFAEQQTAGRGRRGRSFASPAGGLYFSYLLRPACPPMEIMHLTALSAVAAEEAIEKTFPLRADIKWTNDLVIGRKKLSGILTELSVEAETRDVAYAVIGVGINCNEASFPPEITTNPTSLRLELGHSVDRTALALAVIDAYDRLSREMFIKKADWLERFASRCITIGQDVQLIRGDEVRAAHADGIDPDAGLLVTYSDGTKDVITCGEVSVRGMYGYIDSKKQ